MKKLRAQVFAFIIHTLTCTECCIYPTRKRLLYLVFTVISELPEARVRRSIEKYKILVPSFMKTTKKSNEFNDFVHYVSFVQFLSVIYSEALETIFSGNFISV